MRAKQVHKVITQFFQPNRLIWYIILILYLIAFVGLPIMYSISTMFLTELSGDVVILCIGNNPLCNLFHSTMIVLFFTLWSTPFKIGMLAPLTNAPLVILGLLLQFIYFYLIACIVASIHRIVRKYLV